MLRVDHVTVRFGDDCRRRHRPHRRERRDGRNSRPERVRKSTLLRAIAGLQPIGAGRVSWDGEDLASVPTHRRRFGLMFQDARCSRTAT
jgi:hypothetical protein